MSSSGTEFVVQASFPTLPLGKSLAGDLQGTFGLPVVAVVISAFLTGILTMQTYTYYTLFPKDALFRKIMVALIYILDLIQFGCITDYAWWYLVRNWGNVKSLQIIRPSFGLFVIFGSLVIFIVQCLFLQRIISLDRKLRYFSILIMILITIELAFGMVAASYRIRVRPSSTISTKGFTSAVVGIWLGTGVVADTALAAVLSYILHTNRTGVRETESLISKLILYSINTCLLTSIVALLNIIAFYKQDVLKNAHVMFNMILCRLFSNSLLASYNRRASLKNEAEESSLAFSNIETSGILVRTERITGSDSGHIHDGEQSTAMRVKRDPTDKPMIFNHDWDLEMYPVGVKTVDITEP